MTDKKDIGANETAVTGTNPYKALFSYEEEDRHIFKGRDWETKKLFKLIKTNLLTLVFGKSGIGKTSLLNAGVAPQLRENRFLPVRIRLNFAPDAPAFLEQIRESVSTELTAFRILEMEGTKPAKPFASGESLWGYFHRVNHCDASGRERITPVLILDQFEEIFTIGKEHRGLEDLIHQLYYLLEDQIPDDLKERILDEGKGFPYFGTKPDVKVMISLR
ncbi:MAG: ATP-binding protein, partial [bacterium]|nr:ATP-binding protein [bacterium]